MTNGTVFRRVIARTVATMVCAATFAGLAATQEPRIDILKVDPFSRPEWRGGDIEILGFYPGMTREEMRLNARQRGFRLDPWENNSLPCDPKSVGSEAVDACNVYVGSGTIGLVFNDKNLLRSILLSVPYFSPKSDSAANRSKTLTWQLRGALHQLFWNYSDESRVSLLGEPDQVLKLKSLPYRPYQLVDYCKRGLSFRTEGWADERTGIMKFDVTDVEFSIPGPCGPAPPYWGGS
jgi:hypothetical protein